MNGRLKTIVYTLYLKLIVLKGIRCAKKLK